MSSPSTICVCGAGTMGSGIAQVFASHGFKVLLFDVSSDNLDKARRSIQASIQQLNAKGKISEEQLLGIAQNISTSANINDCKADLVVEAVVEDAEVKAGLINNLFDINAPHTIIATNTSSLSINDLSTRVAAPRRFAGMHFFNPATLMKLVEIVVTPVVDANVVNTLKELVSGIGKTPVVCNDAPGFIVNRVARPYYLEAMYLVQQYQVDTQVIDSVMENTGFKLGPFKLMDLIGNDVNYSVSTIVYEALSKPPRLKPSDIQRVMVSEGRLGRKTGRGFYDY